MNITNEMMMLRKNITQLRSVVEDKEIERFFEDLEDLD